MYCNSGYIVHRKSDEICIKYNIDTFITLNGYRLIINEPLLITYSNDTYFTIYVARYLYPALLFQPKPIVYNRSHMPVEVVWFDANILLNTNDTFKTKGLLEQSADSVYFYTNRRLMINEIKLRTSSSIFLIISGIEAYDVLFEIHSLSQLDTVFIFCSLISKYRVLKRMYPKVIGVFSQHDKMIGNLHFQLNRIKEQNTIKNLYKDSISFDRISPTLWWTRLLCSYLRKGHQPDTYAQDDMLKMCYPYFRTDISYQKVIFDFEMNYFLSGKTINWYTKDTFLYRIINQALRAADYYAVYTFRHYVIELSQHLEKLHLDLRRILCGEVGTVYRGAVMSKQEFERIQGNIGRLVITKSFLSATWYSNVAKPFADIGNQTIRDTVSVIFEIFMDSCLDEDCRCGDISSASNMKSEGEILFDIGSVFHVITVEYIRELNYWHVKMKSNDSNNYNTAEEYMEQLKRELSCFKQEVACGRLMVEMGMFDEALIHYNRILKLKKRKRELAHICLSIGRIYNQREQQSDGIVALVYYYWALQHDETISKAYEFACKLICQLSPPERVLKWRVNSENIAHAYYRLNQMKEARDLYFELVETCLHSTDTDYLKLGQYLNNLASTFEPFEAYIIYKDALLCLQRILPSRHPLILETQRCLSTLNYNNSLYSLRPIIKVYIQLSGTHFSRMFLVEPSDTVKQLKIRLQKFYHIQRHKQTLIYNNQILNDSQRFQNHILEDEVLLVWKIRPIRKTRIICIFTKRKLIRLSIQFTYSIFHIKQLIHIKYRYPPPSYQRLLFRNKELDDDTLVYDSLCSDPRFNLIHKVEKKTKNIVFHLEMLTDNDTMQVNCDPARITVHHLKKTIERERGVPVKWQRILLDNQEITEDRAYLTIYNVKRHTTLSLDLTISSIITVIVKYKTNQINIKISPRATIRKLKEELNKQFHISVDDQKLLLLPSRFELSPNNHSILKVFKKCQNNETLNITVELIVLSNVRLSDIQVTYSDREQVHEISIYMDTTIKDLRQIISKKSDIKIRNMKLCVNGKTIDRQNICWDETDIAKNQTVFVYHTDPKDSFLIKIRLLDNDDSFEIRLPGNATIESLTQFLKHWIGIKSEEQQLFYQTTELKCSDEPLQQFAGRIIDILRHTDTFIFLQYDTPALENNTVPIKVEPNDIVAVIKTKVEKKLNTSLKQYLLSLHGKLLKNYDNLSSLISIRDILYLYPSDIAIQYIYVQSPETLEQIPIELNQSMTVRDVHEKIALHIGLPEDQQELFFHDHQLGDKNQSLESYGITSGSILQLIHIVSLRIAMTNNCLFSVTIDQFSNIHKLKSIIYRKGFAMSVGEQKLIYFGIQLEDDLKIEQCRFENHSVVLLLTKKDEEPEETLSHNSEFDPFATERENIWTSRLAHLDGKDDEIDDDSDDYSNNDDDDDDSNNDDDDDDSNNDDDDDDSNNDDDEGEPDGSSDGAKYNNQCHKMTYLFKDDDDDLDDSIPIIRYYRADQK